MFHSQYLCSLTQATREHVIQFYASYMYIHTGRQAPTISRGVCGSHPEDGMATMLQSHQPTALYLSKPIYFGYKFLGNMNLEWLLFQNLAVL
jgi:hypothetical protein